MVGVPVGLAAASAITLYGGKINYQIELCGKSLCRGNRRFQSRIAIKMEIGRFGKRRTQRIRDAWNTTRQN